MTAKRKEESPLGQTGYPAVERLIDTEDFNELNTVFEAAYADLVALSDRRGGFKTKQNAKKVMRVLELTMDLLRELLAIKYRLAEEAQKSRK